MIDFHNHVLPGVDDGPKTMDESLDMLRYAHKQGITEIVQTVHFQHPKMEGKNVDYNYLSSEIEKIQNQIDKENLNIKMHLAAEVFYLPNLVKISKNPLVTIGNKKYMLIEFKTNIYPIGYEDELFNLQSIGITPIIAHPERYVFIQKDINILEQWKNRGYVIQLDAGSILGYFGENIKKLSIKMIKAGYVHLLGSDAHNNKKRNFCLKDAYTNLVSIITTDEIKKMELNVSNILYGKAIINIDQSDVMKFSIHEYIKEKIKNIIKFN